MHGKLLLGVGVVVVVVAAYVLFGSSGPGPAQFAAFNRTNGAIPSSLSMLNNLSGNAATQSLGSLAQKKLANTTQFTVLYSGNVTGHYSVIGVSSPFIIFDSKYGSMQKFIVNVSSVEAYGPVTAVYLNLTNGTFTCTNVNTSAISSQNYEAALLGSHAIRCSRTNLISGLNFGDIAAFNFSQLVGGAVVFNYNKAYQSTYKGTPCTYVSGSFTISGSASSGGIFQECLSDIYYVPLSLELYSAGKGGSVSLSMNETSISNSSYQSSIDSMPG